MTAIEAGIQNPITIHFKHALSEAADRMIVHQIGRLPVVEATAPHRLVGIITRKGVLQARTHNLEAEKRA